MDDYRRAEGYGYPRVFVFTFCKQEFESRTSVISYMSEIHEVPPTNS